MNALSLNHLISFVQKMVVTEPNHRIINLMQYDHFDEYMRWKWPQFLTTIFPILSMVNIATYAIWRWRSRHYSMQSNGFFFDHKSDLTYSLSYHKIFDRPLAYLR